MKKFITIITIMLITLTSCERVSEIEKVTDKTNIPQAVIEKMKDTSFVKDSACVTMVSGDHLYVIKNDTVVSKINVVSHTFYTIWFGLLLMFLVWLIISIIFD